MKSKIERQIGCLIRQQFPACKIEENIRPRWLESDRGERLELDYFIPELKLAFEIQGAQHFSYVPFYHSTYADFEAQQYRDREKRRICREKGVVLIEVASADEYETVQAEVLRAINRFESKRLENHILEKSAQTLINIIAIQNKMRANRERRDEMPPSFHESLDGKFAKLVANLEQMHELLRYLSIRAIQDFHGLLPFNKRGKEKMAELRRAKKTTLHRKLFNKRAVRDEGNMKQWI